MNQAAKFFLLQTVEDRSWVGLVTFDGSAQVRSELVQIKSDADRDALTKHLPTVSSGGTSICSGLQSAFTVRYALLLWFASVCHVFFLSNVSLYGQCLFELDNQEQSNASNDAKTQAPNSIIN